MGLTNIRLGDYIERSTINNKDLKYGVDLIVGVNSQGVFATPKGNTDGVDLKPYKIVENGAFVYNPTRLELGSIAYRTEGLCIVSHLYMVFYLTDEGKKIIDPMWLYIYFRRSEFCREVKFRNFGSQRPEFNFNDMSDIVIPLPDIEIQKKYVDIYNAMLENQKSYERGLDDLKLSFEALLDEYKHKVEKMPIGSLLKEVDNRNMNGSIKNVQGINITKQFMPSVANTNGVDLSKYKVVNKGQFVFSGMQTGRDKCIRIALFDKVEPIIISPAYAVLEIIDADVLAEYTSVAPTSDDVEQATSVFREELEVLKNMFTGYDLSPFLNPECDPIERYRLLAKAAEYVFVSTEELQSEGNKGVQKVSFKTYFLKTVKRMRTAFDICQPSGYLGEEESALAQCFMAIAGFVRKMSGTSEVDTDTMNRAVSKMVEEALKYNQVESVLESGEEEDIFSPEYFEKLSDVKMPATKLELLVKMLRKQIKEYGKVNQLAAKSFQEMLEKTIAEYHERRKHLTAEEAGEAQEQASEDIIKIATEQALAILRQMNENRESFRKIGLTFEEKAFYDILISLRDQYNFEYGTDKEVDGVIVNDKCKALAKKIKDIIDTKSSFADWLNNQNVRNGLKLEIKICLVKNGYPPQYSPEVFNKVMEQVENFEEYSVTEGIGSEATTSGKIYEYEPEHKVMMVAEDPVEYGKE